jgi:hypothetical protein
MASNLLHISYCNYSTYEQKNFSSIFKKKFKNSFVWTPKIINENYKHLKWTVRNYQKFFKKKNKKIKFHSQWLQNGCHSWKPQIIYFSLKDLCKPNDIIIYHDINFKKYPVYLNNFDLSDAFFFNLIRKYSLVLFRDTYQPLKAQCKNFLLNRFNLQNFKNKNGFWSGSIIVKNNFKGMAFIKKWCAISTIENLGPLPDTAEKDASFFMNAVDQSTLSILYYKEKKFQKYIKVVYAPFRKFFKFNFFYLRSIKEFIKIKYFEFKN